MMVLKLSSPANPVPGLIRLTWKKESWITFKSGYPFKETRKTRAGRIRIRTVIFFLLLLVILLIFKEHLPLVLMKKCPKSQIIFTTQLSGHYRLLFTQFPGV